MNAQTVKHIDGTFYRTARKTHRCRQCGRLIEQGTRYAEYIGEVPAYQSGSRYHLGPCADYQLGATAEIARTARALLARIEGEK